MRGISHLPVLVAVILAGLWGAWLGLAHWRGEASILDRIEGPLTDLRFLIRGQRAAPDHITIIAVDDATVQEIGAYPIPRATMAALVEAIAESKPKVIALDFLFVDPSSSSGDRALADAMGKAQCVIAAAGIFDQSRQTVTSSDGDLGRAPTIQRLLMPLEEFARVAAVGIVNITTDASGVPRHVPLLAHTDSRLVPSFALRVSSAALRQDPIIEPNRIVFGGQQTATDIGYALPLRFYGPRGAIRTISANEILRGDFPKDAIHNQIVIIGATVTGGGDVFPTPFDPVLPGVEVLATATAHLTAGDGLMRDRTIRLVDAIMATLLPMILIVLLSWHRSAMSFAFIAVIVLVWIGLTAVVFFQGIWLSAGLPIAAVVPPVIMFGAAQLWFDRRRADTLARERRILSRFQPPNLARRLADDPDFLAIPVRQEAALIFIDLSGFTGLSEGLGPGQTRDVLKSFHALVDEEAVRHGGVVASFMGDGAMLLFGLPDSRSEDACNAVEACVALSLRTREWLASLPDSVSARLGFKIGAHYGTIIASRLGGESHEHITAIGDTVNVASRLMEVAASYGADVALSEELHHAAGPACSVLDLGTIDGTLETSIRGRSGSIQVWLWRGVRKPVKP